MCAQVPGKSVCRGEDGGGQRVLPSPLLPLLLLRPTAGLYQRLRRSRQQGEAKITKISLNARQQGEAEITKISLNARQQGETEITKISFNAIQQGEAGIMRISLRGM
jgi:hypothetical protein